MLVFNWNIFRFTALSANVRGLTELFAGIGAQREREDWIVELCPLFGHNPGCAAKVVSCWKIFGGTLTCVTANNPNGLPFTSFLRVSLNLDANLRVYQKPHYVNRNGKPGASQLRWDLRAVYSLLSDLENPDLKMEIQLITTTSTHPASPVKKRTSAA